MSGGAKARIAAAEARLAEARAAGKPYLIAAAEERLAKASRRILVGGKPMPSVNQIIRDEIITHDAYTAAEQLPEGSARTVIAELRKAALQLLGLQLQRTNPGNEETETLDRCQAVGHLSVSGLREILEVADHVLSDRHRVTRTDLDQDSVVGRGSDELLQFADRGDDRPQGVGPKVQPLDELAGGHQVFIDSARVECHHSLLTSARVPARHVAGAFLVPLRWLQRRQWVRRAGAILRPSDTTTGGTITATLQTVDADPGADLSITVKTWLPSDPAPEPGGSR